MNNILFICSSLERTGPTNQLLNIVKNNNMNFSIITLSREKINSMVDDFLDLENVNVYLRENTSIVEIISLILNSKVIHTQGIKADILSGTLFWKNNISTLRNYPYEDYPPLYGKVKGSLMAHIHLFFLKFIKHRVTISDSTALKNRTKTNMMFDVIYNGVDVDKFSPKKKCSIDIKAKLGIFNNNKIFIYTGPLIKRKNVNLLVKLFNNNKDYNLIIVGDGDELQYLNHHSGTNIFFTGSVDNVVDYLNIADVFIMLSSSEGFPNSVMEALSVGLPCVLSNIPSHIDVKKIMKENIFIYDGNELNEFIELNEMIFKLNKQQIREQIILKLSGKKMASKYNELYSKY